MIFATDVNTESSNLKTEKDYVNFAKRVSGVLYEGSTPYNLPAFMKELVHGINKAKISAMDLKKIVDTVTVVYNSKVQEEKKNEGGKKKNSKKGPQIAGGKAADVTYSRNNNPNMVGDLVGDEENDEYGDYGEEAVWKGREAEEAYDFM